MNGSATAAARAARLGTAVLAVCGALAAAACPAGSPAPTPEPAVGSAVPGAGGPPAAGNSAGREPADRPSFPSWEERVLHEWTNRARVDPGADLAACDVCPDRACYSPAPPLEWSLALNRAARFHADAMQRQDFFTHESPCRVAADIDSRYPHSCDGSASCACAGPGPTRFSERLKLFGVPRPSGEVQAEHPDDPVATFYYLLHEPTSSARCASTAENGHRWNLLKQTGTVGFGTNGTHTVGDFGRSPGPGGPVPSGAHYPRQAETVEFWANWRAEAGPGAAHVSVDGRCAPLALSRGTAANGAWSASVSGLGSGCHRYVFVFRDASGAVVTHPSRGSFGIGPAATCADWEEGRPADAPTCP
jgi:hypothetical protein